MEEILSSGAEAVILRVDDVVIKRRISKGYRVKEIDNKIRKIRTKSEAKILKRVFDVVNVPRVLDVDEKNFEIKMDFVNGERLSVFLDIFDLKKQKKICFMIGEGVAKFHSEKVIHGDLTTSNMILKDGKVFFIDFGLGYFNGKYEDMAVDLHLLRQAFEAKHFRNWQCLFEFVKEGYLSVDKDDGEKVLKRFEAVERRGRYKH